MTPDLLTILPNLSIGVVSIVALVYVVLKFLKTLDDRADKHERARKEGEDAMRALETSVRQSLTEHLSLASIALQENTKALARVIRHLDGEKQ